MNSRLPMQPKLSQTTPNIRFCFIKGALHRTLSKKLCIRCVSVEFQIGRLLEPNTLGCFTCVDGGPPEKNAFYN